MLALPVAICSCRSLVALLLNSRHLRGPAVFRVLFFLPYVIPFVAGVLIWQGMLNLETGWINGVLAFIGIEQPAELAQRPGLDLPGPRVHRASGASAAGIIVNLAGLRGIPTELYDAAQDRRRRLVGASSAT